MSPPAFIFGGGLLNVAWREEDIPALLSALEVAGIKHIDSAAVYPGAERLLGSSKASEKGFSIDTKVLVYGDGSGNMSPEAIQKSLAGSLESLGVQKVNTYYCHSPDHQTPIAEQAAAMHTEYLKGSFSQLGVSNFSSGMLEEWLRIADEQGFIKPIVYQGQYNLLCRTYETTIFPLLRKHNIGFFAYSPLGGGFLTGKLTFAKKPEDLQGTRFEVSDTNYSGMRYRGFYDKPAMHEALRKAAPLCEEHGIPLGEAAMRWLLYHSTLNAGKGDGITIGPGTLSQLDEYVKARDAGSLPEGLARGLSALWDDKVEEAATPNLEY